MRRIFRDVLKLAFHDAAFITTMLIVLTVAALAAIVGHAEPSLVVALLIVGCVTAVIEFRAHMTNGLKD
jgi:hypothetical protein